MQAKRLLGHASWLPAAPAMREDGEQRQAAAPAPAAVGGRGAATAAAAGRRACPLDSRFPWGTTHLSDGNEGAS